MARVLVIATIATSLLGCTKKTTAPATPYPTAASKKSEPMLDPKLQGWLENYLAAFKRSDPNQRFYGEVLLAHAKRGIFQASYGGPQERRFLVGSITKSMTAIAIMQLEQKGKLKLGDSVRVYIPELPASYAPITIEQLLAHRSGLGNYTSDQAIMKRAHLPHSTQEMLRAVTKAKLQSKPGEHAYYSNSGYVLLGIVVERASGQPWSTYLEQQLFAPAKMHQTGIGREQLVQGWIPKGEKWVLAQNSHSSFAYASGAIVSTASDLNRFARALHEGVLVPKEVFKRMWSYDPEPKSQGPFGLGLGFTRTKLPDGQLTIGHDGSMFGFRSSFRMTPDGSWTVVVLSNTQTPGVGLIARDLLTMALDKASIQPPKAQKRAPFDPEIAKQLAGVYKLSPEDRKKMQLETSDEMIENIATAQWLTDGYHSLKYKGIEAFDIYPLENGHFENDGLEQKLDIEVLYQDDRPTGYVLRQGSFSARYEKQ